MALTGAGSRGSRDWPVLSPLLTPLAVVDLAGGAQWYAKSF